MLTKYMIGEQACPAKSCHLLKLLAVCAFAVWLWLPAIEQGLPYFYQEDEAHHFNRTVEMVKSGDFNPHYFHKPSLHFYLRMPVVAASFLWGVGKGYIRSIKEIETRDPYGVGGYAFNTSHPFVVKWNRLFSITLNILIIILTFHIARSLTGSEMTGFTAAIFSAVSPELLKYSATIGVDVVMSLFCVATVAVALKLQETFSPKLLFVCGLLAGLAVSSKYNAALIALIPLLACILNRKFCPSMIVISIIAPILGFLIGTPYLFASLPLFLDQVAYEIWHYGIAGHEGHSAEPGIAQALFYTQWFAQNALGICITILGVAGFLLLAIKHTKKELIFITFPILYFVLMAEQRANFTRNMLVILPFLSIASAYLIEWVGTRFNLSAKIKPIFAAVLILACSYQPLMLSARERAGMLNTADSRTLAAEWLQKNQRPFLDTAIAGQLQFPQDIYERPGVTRINQEYLNVVGLYQAGFKRLALGAQATLDENSRQLLSIESQFSGEKEKQRVVNNPDITIYAIKKNEEASARLAHLPRQLTFYQRGADSSWSCSPSLLNTESKSAENYCWLEERSTTITLSGLTPFNTPIDPERKTSLTLSLMTPWPSQEATLFGDGWSSTLKFEDSEIGHWKEVALEVPSRALRAKGGFDISITEIHSPYTQHISEDKRRLGVALRDIHIVEE